MAAGKPIKIGLDKVEAIGKWLDELPDQERDFIGIQELADQYLDKFLAKRKGGNTFQQLAEWLSQKFEIEVSETALSRAITKAKQKQAEANGEVVKKRRSSNQSSSTVKGNKPGNTTKGNKPGNTTKGNKPGSTTKGNKPGSTTKGNKPGNTAKTTIPQPAPVPTAPTAPIEQDSSRAVSQVLEPTLEPGVEEEAPSPVSADQEFAPAVVEPTNVKDQPATELQEEESEPELSEEEIRRQEDRRIMEEARAKGFSVFDNSEL